MPAVPLKNIYLDGSSGLPGNNNDEVALDIDMTVCMAPGLSSVIVYEGTLTDDILNRMATDDLANQLSSSWTYSIDSVTDEIFQQMAAQGQSFFNAAGDGDAWVGTIASPSDDPNITSVGGTTLTTSGPGGAWVSETVWNWGLEFGTNYDGVGSGGGISTSYAIPAWQTGVSMANNQGSTSYRNIPDVALTADNIFLVANNGQSGSVGGTSCATPLWAAFTALANEQAAAHGRPPLGFLNPALYALGGGSHYTSYFHDVTTGNNTWSLSPTNYYAVTGYDLCSGWGTPAGSNLINQLAPPDSLQISPPGGFTVSGGVGGPLNPSSQSYVLTNAGNSVLHWSAGVTAPWVNLSATGGTLSTGGASATVVASLNAAANQLYLGTYGGTIWFTNLTDGITQDSAVALTILKPPVITAQPAGLTIIGGSTVTFTAAATGGLPLNCQWQLNGVNLTNGLRISGAQTTLTAAGNLYGSLASTLTISNITAADAGNYALVASNAAATVVSSNALLTVMPSAPVIIQQPLGQTVLFGAPVQFTVSTIGATPFTYQWQQNQTNLTDGGAISGSLTPVLTITTATAASIGTYDVIISNTIGSTTSTGAVLSVQAPTPGGPLVQNNGFETGTFAAWTGTGNFTDCSVSSSAPAVDSGLYGALLGPAGSLGYLSQSVSTVPGQFYLLSLWLDSPDGLTPNEFLVAWNGTATFDQTNLAALGWTNLQFFVQATGTNTVLTFGFRNDASFFGLDDIQLTPLVSVDGPPIIITEPAGQVAPAGGSATFSAAYAGQLPMSYQWQFAGTNLANATNATLTLTNLNLAQAGAYDVLVTNALGWAISSNSPLTVLSGRPLLLTFDDLSGTQVPMPAVYDNLTWSNFYYLDGLTYGLPSGYSAGVLSGDNVVYNAYGAPAVISSSVPFDLLSAGLTAAWEDNLQLAVKGWTTTNLTYDTAYTLNATNPTQVVFNYLGVTSVEFISSGGTPRPGYAGTGENFVMDNVGVFFPSSPPVITLQPVNVTAPAGSAALFTVTAAGSPPLVYNWYKNGILISGAHSAVCTNTSVQYSDYGAQYACLVTNAYGAALSSNATLTVTLPSLVQNGGFETGGFDDWTPGGNFISCAVTDQAPYVHSGQFGAELGPASTPAYLSQTLPTTIGQLYLVSCWLYSSGQTPNSFSLSWNGTNLLNQLNIGDVLWTNLQYQITATVTNTVLTFGFRNDPSYFGLDDIAVYPLTGPSPQIQSASLANSTFTFSWDTQMNQTYQVQTSTNLAQGVWVNWGAPLATTNTTLTVTNATTAAQMQFYRIVLLP